MSLTMSIYGYSYMNPGIIYGSEVYFGGTVAAYAGCLSTGAAGGSLFIEATNVNLQCSTIGSSTTTINLP